MKHDEEPRKVLVIDDDDELAGVVRQVLRDAGYSVATVRHGAAALDLMQHIAPDLILLDLAMPIMDGWSFVRQYRRTARKGARIVLLTANGAAPDIARSLEVDGYIVKPFSIDDLLASVARELPARELQEH
ncbi:MAG TPA: response regulator transcription factor [Candidatus Acidoferrales bacterium]|nr:response regulator transcription factor [Candidatus Acidoferrales bacterium]